MTLVGADTYSFHRHLGEVREGESPPAGLPWSWASAVERCVDLGAEVVGIETCYVRPEELTPAVVDAVTAGVPAVLSWGHPYGLEFAASAAAEADLWAWMNVAAGLGHTLLRIVVGHPHLRHASGSEAQVEQSVPAVRRATERAERLGLTLAVENHADLTSRQLLRLLEGVDSEYLRVCFDTVNALRVEQDVVGAVSRLRPFTVLAHVKDLTADPWHPRSGPVTAPLGQGVLPLDDVVSILLGDGPDVALLVELGHLGPGAVDEEELVEQGMRWLREQCGHAAAGADAG